MKPTWKVILLIMLAGFVGWRVMAQEPQGTRPSSGQPSDPNGLSGERQSDVPRTGEDLSNPNRLSSGQQSDLTRFGGQQSNSNRRAQQTDPAAQKSSGIPTSTSPLSRFAGQGGEPGGTVKGGADVSDLSFTGVPITSDELSMKLEKARQIASEMESASIHRANDARLSMERWDPTDVAGRDRLRKELRLFVMETFKARHAMQRMEVALLEKKLQAMKRKLEEQETKASEIIERRIDDLLNPNLRWDDSAIKNSTTLNPNLRRDDSAIKNSTTEGNGPKAAVPNDVRLYAVQDLPLWSKDGTSQHIDLLIHYLETRVDSTKNGGDKIGSYDPGRGMLVVRGDGRKQRQIAQLIAELREMSGQPVEDLATFNSIVDLGANSAQSAGDLAKEKLVKTYSVADLPIWSKDGKKQHVDLLLSYLRLNVDPPSWESKVTRAAYNVEMLALVVQGTPEVHNGIKAALSRLRGQTNLYGNPNASTSNVPSSKSNSADPNAFERIQEAKAVSPPQLFGAKAPSGVQAYEGIVREWIGGERRAGTLLADGDAFKPVPYATIHLYRVSPIAKGGSGYQFEEIEVFKSDKQGHFKINIPDILKRFIQTPGTIESDDWESVLMITMSAPGFATDTTTLAANRRLDSIELIRGTSIRGRLVDEHERPIVGAHVTVNAQSRATSREEMDEWLRQTSKEPLPKATFDPADTDALLAARKPASIANHDVQWIPTQIEGVVTDQEGRFTIDGIGPDDVLDLNVECVGYNSARIKVIGRDIETVYSRDPFASGENIAVHGRTLQATLIASDRGSPHSRHRVIKGERKKGQVEASASDASTKDE